MRRPVLLLLPFLLLMTLFTGCDELDIKLVNQIKTFGPKWTLLGDKLNEVDHLLGLIEGQLEQDMSEVKPLFGQIDDTLRTGQYWRDLKKYEELIVDRDSLRAGYTIHRATFSESVGAFNKWEKRVMDGEVAPGIATSDLTKFKQTYKQLDQVALSNTKRLKELISAHNRIMRSLTDKLGVYTNYDIHLK